MKNPSDDEFEHEDIEERVTDFSELNSPRMRGPHTCSPHGLHQGMTGPQLTTDARNMAYTRHHGAAYRAETSPTFNRMLDSAVWSDRNAFDDLRRLVVDRGPSLYRQSLTGETEMRERTLERSAGILEGGRFFDGRYPRTFETAMEQRMARPSRIPEPSIAPQFESSELFTHFTGNSARLEAAIRNNCRKIDVQRLKRLVLRQSELVDSLRQEKARRVRQKNDAARKRRAEHRREENQQDFSTSLFQDGSAAAFASTSLLDPPNSGWRRHEEEDHLTSRSLHLGHDTADRHHGSSSTFTDEEIPQGRTLQTDHDSRPVLPARQHRPLLAASDEDFLSGYQLLIRQSLEFFEAQPSDMESRQGRKKSVTAGQVGIRCRYCAHRSRHLQARGSVYFPGNLTSVYQSAQNMAKHHLLTSCEDVPPEVKEELLVARKRQEQETRRSGGKRYWVSSCQAMGLIERPELHGLWFVR